MNDQSPVDWLSATQDERAQLYRVIRAIADMTGQTVEAVIEQAIGTPLLTGTDYLSNVRKGKISRSKARLIHAWIQRKHPAAAQAIVPELFPLLHTDAWERFVAEHAVAGKLRVVPLARTRGLIRRTKASSEPQQTLRLGQEFCFELDSDIDGFATAFQGFRGQWHPLPLSEDGEEPHAPIKRGTQLLPWSNADLAPIALCECEDTGPHRFVITLAESVPLLAAPQALTGRSLLAVTCSAIIQHV